MTKRCHLPRWVHNSTRKKGHVRDQTTSCTPEKLTREGMLHPCHFSFDRKGDNTPTSGEAQTHLSPQRSKHVQFSGKPSAPPWRLCTWGTAGQHQRRRSWRQGELREIGIEVQRVERFRPRVCLREARCAQLPRHEQRISTHFRGVARRACVCAE